MQKKLNEDEKKESVFMKHTLPFGFNRTTLL